MTDAWYTAERQSSLFTFVELWPFADARTEAEALTAYRMVWYGAESWPSRSEWMIPRSEII